MTITSGAHNNFEMGNDFVSAVTGPYLSHGKMTVNGVSYTWKSTEKCTPSENALYALARKEGKKLTYMESQALEVQ